MSKGLPDSDKDAKPMEKYDDAIFINTSKYIDNITNDHIDELEQKGKATYNCRPEPLIKFDFPDIVRGKILENIYIRGLSTTFCFYFPNGATFLRHFLGNTGDDYYYDATEVIEETNNGKNHYDSYVKEIMLLCENTVIDELNFVSRPSTRLCGTDFSDVSIKIREKAADWKLAIGNTEATFSINCKKIGNKYYADITYNILDYYDFEKGSKTFAGLATTDELYDLHEAGMAQEYKSIGQYRRVISWNKGETTYATTTPSVW